MIFRLVTIGLAVLATTLTTGCGGRAAPRSDLSRATLVYGRGEDANTLDPIHTDIGESVKVIVNLFDTLVAYGDESLDITPSLATDWTVGEDGTVWTFRLRAGVVFQDGTPLTAEAVVVSIERLIQEEHPLVFEPARPYRPSYAMIGSVEATGPLEVQFRLKAPSAVFLKNLAMFPASIVSPTALQKAGKEFGTQPVGTGPFRLSKWVRNQQLVVEAFPEHWRGAPRVPRAVFVPISETATRIQQLTRGEIDIVDDVPPQELDALRANPEITLQREVGLNVAYLAMQMEKKPLDHPLVRRAIWQAIDKHELVRVAFAGQAEPAVTLVPPAMWGHHDQLVDRVYDPAEAARLMREAAAEANFSLPLPLVLSVMTQSRPYLPQPLRVASFVKDALQPIGIAVRIEPQPVNEHFAKLMAGRFEMGLAGWMTDNSDPDNFLYSLLDPDNIGEYGNNLSRYRSDAMHALLTEAQRELNEPRRAELYRQAQELAFADAPVVPLAHVQLNSAQRARVKGYRLHPSSLVFLRRAYLEESP